MDSAMLSPGGPSDAFRIPRKPVSNPNLRAAVDPPFHAAASSLALVPPPLSRPPSYTDLYGPSPQKPPSRPEPIPRPRTAGAASSSAPVSPQPPPTPVQKAYGEARHFLGGLINHPTESNRHFTILRHSHGLVFYRGNATSVAVSIFSDSPLPEDRTLWLQSKGWSGKTGMRTKALFRLNDSWLDVTPVMPLRAESVNPDDERAWQRDIKKFYKKAPPRPRDKHELRETAVVRIPAEAGDGYFQLVLCQGAKKKTLANSPVFRVLSTSANPHSLRGASLSTLPLEVGAMVVSLYAQTAARTVANPAAAAVATRVNPYKPSWVKKAAVQKVYSASGVETRVAGLFTSTAPPGQGFAVDGCPSPITGHSGSPVEEGPQDPFPMTFKARCQFGHSTPFSSPTETPKITLIRTPDWVSEQLRGYFFGWARFDMNTSKSSSPTSWTPMILAVRSLDPLQASRVDMAQVSKHVVTLRLLDEVPLQTTKSQVRVMGFLRAEVPHPRGTNSQELADAQAAATEAAILADAYDADVVQNTLMHPAWSPETLSPLELQKQNLGWVDRTMEGYATIRAKGQKWVEQVPLHKLGVRSVMDEWRERQVAVNGFFIVR
ncbi:hypothetical protein N7532_002227 [Penicillium argentinense]|uniref:LipA and NB-ARC domain protein n=1 Tax=Penicillium argentinense TaxID=1131581 RepID=A0A9W9G1K6_9EURO|nr:uncharacterized protein N7532_002227 [Penicillium argentinense]KAJ5109582.1 hypothetical protein N7532_002227 [Penicillium argentinense]